MHIICINTITGIDCCASNKTLFSVPSWCTYLRESSRTHIELLYWVLYELTVTSSIISFGCFHHG
jgi:hypothetical protein